MLPLIIVSILWPSTGWELKCFHSNLVVKNCLDRVLVPRTFRHQTEVEQRYFPTDQKTNERAQLIVIITWAINRRLKKKNLTKIYVIFESFFRVCLAIKTVFCTLNWIWDCANKCEKRLDLMSHNVGPITKTNGMKRPAFL